MVTSKDCFNKYGAPEKESHMVLWHVPEKICLGAIPKLIYCNEDMVKPLELALATIIDRDLIHYVRTWDGCFNIRRKRSGASASLHSWGIAIDINAAWNGFGKKPTMPASIVQAFKDSGFDWGGDWRTPDGMHFQLSNI